MAPRVDTPRWLLPRWIEWAVGFKVASLAVDAVCIDPGRRHDAPFNTVVRGLIGKRLRDLRCLTQADTCAGCPETARCDYASVFARRLMATESDSEGDEVPPFWLQGLPADRALARGVRLSIRLHVAGQAVGVLPYLDVACRDALVHVGTRPSASVVPATDLRTFTHEPIKVQERVGGVVGRVLGAALEDEGWADHAIERGEVRSGRGALDAAQHLLGVDVGQSIERAVEMHRGSVHLGGDLGMVAGYTASTRPGSSPSRSTRCHAGI